MVVEKIHTCTGHRASLYALARGSDSGHFITAGGDGWIVEWDLDEPDTGKLVASTESRIFTLCHLNEQAIIVAGTMEGGLHWIYRHQPEKNRDLKHHRKGVYDLLSDGVHLFSAGGDGLLTRWDVESGRSIESVQLSGMALRSLAYCAPKKEIAVGASDHHIYIVDAETLELKTTIRDAHGNSVFSVAYDPGHHYLLSGGRDALLKVWETNSWKPSTLTPELPAHLFTINHLAFSPDAALLASASRDKTIKIWDGHSFELLKVIDTIRSGGHINSVNRLLWLDGNLVSVSDDRSAMIWKVLQ